MTLKSERWTCIYCLLSPAFEHVDSKFSFVVSGVLSECLCGLMEEIYELVLTLPPFGSEVPQASAK